MRTTRIIGIILTGILLILGACSSTSKAPSTAQIKIQPLGAGTEGWRPNTVVVSTGGVVTWLSSGLFQHSVISGEGLFNQILASGQSFNYTFDKPGTYTYHDDPNNELDTVVVK